MTEQRRIKCRYCDYTVPDYYTTKSGERRSGFTRLQNHMEHKHSSEILAVKAQLDARRYWERERSI